MTTRVTVPVCFRRDPRSGTWSYLIQVGTLLGGNCSTLEAAREHAYAALLRALEEPDDESASELTGSLTLDVRRIEAAAPQPAGR